VQDRLEGERRREERVRLLLLLARRLVVVADETQPLLSPTRPPLLLPT